MKTNLKHRFTSKARDLLRRKQRQAKFSQSHAFLIGEVS